MEIPAHIAIIMDGNGRWARKRLLPRSAGHRAGAQTLRRIAKDAAKLGLKYLTVYAFSTENWKRPVHEVDDLMGLLREYLRQYINEVISNDLRITVIGERTRLAEDLRQTVAKLEEETKNKKGMTIVIALNYGGRDEILRAVRKVCESGIPANDLTEERFSMLLDTGNIPDPELIIRTSGEMRMSNFLIWQGAYAEFYVTDKLWPDFQINDLKDAIAEYHRRDRRLGGV